MAPQATPNLGRVETGTRHGGADDAASGADDAAIRARRQQQREARQGSLLRAALRWLRRKLLARLVRWVAGHLPGPLGRLGALLEPGREHGFGFWWLVATVGIAIALGMVVAFLLSPVAALIALLVVAIWALVRSRRHKRDDPDCSRAPARDAWREGASATA